jgi:hydroxyacylglutathione hydrolase
VVDLRPEDDFARAHVPGTLSIGVSSRRFNSHIGWFVDYNRPFYFIAPAAQAVPDILAALRAIGVDDIPGYFLPDVVTQGAVASLPRITTPELAQRMQGSDLLLLDVRGRAEYAEGHIDGALNIPMGHIPQRLDTIPHDRPVITYCASGYRSQAAASLLRARGYDNVTNLHADQAEWVGLLPVRA